MSSADERAAAQATAVRRKLERKDHVSQRELHGTKRPASFAAQRWYRSNVGESCGRKASGRRQLDTPAPPGMPGMPGMPRSQEESPDSLPGTALWLVIAEYRMSGRWHP